MNGTTEGRVSYRKRESGALNRALYRRCLFRSAAAPLAGWHAELLTQEADHRLAQARVGEAADVIRPLQDQHLRLSQYSQHFRRP